VGSLSTHLPEIQEEIVGKHNELRKSVSPSASNMLKMVRSSMASKEVFSHLSLEQALSLALLACEL
jgi:hypothetical protein